MRAEGRWEAMGGSDLIVTEWADGGGGGVVSVRPPERAGRDVPAVRWVGGGLGVPPPPVIRSGVRTAVPSPPILA